MRRLQRGPAMLFFFFFMVSVFLTGYYHLPKTTVKNHQVEKKSLSYEVLKEDVDLAAHYYKSVGKKSDSSYKRVTFTIKKNEKVLGYNIGKTQSFSKYLKLVGPKSKDMIGKVEATKVAYTLVLSGDLVQVIDNKTNQSYTLIDNARLAYRRVPYYMTDETNSEVTYLRNGVKKTESIAVFKDALEDINISKNVFERTESTSENTGQE